MNTNKFWYWVGYIFASALIVCAAICIVSLALAGAVNLTRWLFF